MKTSHRVWSRRFASIQLYVDMCMAIYSVYCSGPLVKILLLREALYSQPKHGPFVILCNLMGGPWWCEQRSTWRKELFSVSKLWNGVPWTYVPCQPWLNVVIFKRMKDLTTIANIVISKRVKSLPIWLFCTPYSIDSCNNHNIFRECFARSWEWMTSAQHLSYTLSVRMRKRYFGWTAEGGGFWMVRVT